MTKSMAATVYRAVHPLRGLNGENGKEASHIVSSIAALGLIGTYCYVTASGSEVPGHLLEIVTLVVGFLFGMHYPK